MRRIISAGILAGGMLMTCFGAGEMSGEDRTLRSLNTPFEYRVDRHSGEQHITFSARILDPSSGRIVRDPSFSITIDGARMTQGNGRAEVQRTTRFEPVDSASVLVVNNSGWMRALHSERAMELVRRITASLPEQYGVVIYGNAFNEVRAGWLDAVGATDEVARALRMEGASATPPDITLAFQDMARKLSERQVPGVRSVFIITDGTEFERVDIQEISRQVMRSMNHPALRQQVVDYYVIDVGGRHDASSRIRSFAREVSLDPDRFFTLDEAGRLLDAVRTDRKVDLDVTIIASTDILPMDGLPHLVEAHVETEGGRVSLGQRIRTQKAGIPYKTFVMAGIALGLFAIIALAVLMLLARKM